MHAVAGHLVQADRAGDLDGLAEQAEPRDGIGVDRVVVPEGRIVAVGGHDLRGPDRHDPVGVIGGDRVLDGILVKTWIDRGPVLADELAEAEAVGIVLGDIEPHVLAGDDLEVPRVQLVTLAVAHGLVLRQANQHSPAASYREIAARPPPRTQAARASASPRSLRCLWTTRKSKLQFWMT